MEDDKTKIIKVTVNCLRHPAHFQTPGRTGVLDSGLALKRTRNKAAVVSLVQRNGDVRSHHVQRVTAANLRPIIEANIASDAHIMTDSGTVLAGALMGRNHSQVNHTRDEYVRRERGVKITTNTVEGYFATLKRGINGVYHHVGSQHLHRYLDEFDFRYNTRKISDGERTERAIGKVAGKRLMYKGIVSKPN